MEYATHCVLKKGTSCVQKQDERTKGLRDEGEAMPTASPSASPSASALPFNILRHVAALSLIKRTLSSTAPCLVLLVLLVLFTVSLCMCVSI